MPNLPFMTGFPTPRPRTNRPSAAWSSCAAVLAVSTGGRSAGLAYQILQAGFQLDIPLMFAALFLIAISGVALYLLMVGLNNALLGHWHESSMAEEH